MRRRCSIRWLYTSDSITDTFFSPNPSHLPAPPFQKINRTFIYSEDPLETHSFKSSLRPRHKEEKKTANWKVGNMQEVFLEKSQGSERTTAVDQKMLFWVRVTSVIKVFLCSVLSPFVIIKLDTCFLCMWIYLDDATPVRRRLKDG